MKPTVKVWPLPKLSESQLKNLALTIVDTCQGFPDLKVQSTADLMVEFAQDMMKWGLGEDLAVEIQFIWNAPHTVGAYASFENPATAIAMRVLHCMEEYGFKPKTRVTWSLVSGRSL